MNSKSVQTTFAGRGQREAGLRKGRGLFHEISVPALQILTLSLVQYAFTFEFILPLIAPLGR